MSNLKYIIYNEPLLAVGNKIFSCGGCIALYSLFNDLKKIGEKVYLSHPAEQFILGLEPFVVEDFFNKDETPLEDCVTIYPEITSGNPMNSKHVVRWLLHYPDYQLGRGSETWREDDLLFAYAPWIIKETKERGHKVEGQILKTLHINYDIFKDRKEPRKGTCYTVRKGGEGERDQLPLGAVDISNTIEEGDPYSIAGIFNQYENFYSYDGRTTLSSLAALCGCNSVIACRSEPKEAFFAGQLDFWKYGIAYGANDIDHARTTRHLLKDALEKEKESCLSSVKNFIIHTKENFK